jgi:general secretion pathway protein F
MAIFSYKAIDATGKEVKATLTAENMVQAKQRLNSAGIMILSVEEKTSGKESAFSVGSKRSIKIQDLSLMTRQLATLIRAKIPIAEAFNALTDQVDHPELRLILSEVKQKINEGASVARALSDYPKVFNNVYINMVEAGEASGTLEIVLLRLAEFTEGQAKLKNKVMSAMLYPIIMGTVSFALMTFIFVVIIPKVTKIFISMKRELPIPTQICIQISYIITNFWWAFPIIIPLCLYAFNRYIATPKGKDRWHSFQLKTPLLGNIITMINIGRFCSTLATLLNSGVPILVSLKIVKNLISNAHIQNAIEESRTAVAEGSSITGPLISSGLFPPMVTHMIKLGEKSGELESMLQIVSENYEDQVNNKLEGLTSTLEPIMMVVMGMIVLFVVIAVVVPMMNINSLRG